MKLVVTLIGALVLTSSVAASGGNAGTSRAREEVIAAERARLRAFAQDNKPAFERLVSDDLTIVHSDGSIGRKADELANMRPSTPEQPLPSLNLETPEVRVHGNMAVMTGQLVERKDGRSVLRLTFTNTYAKRRGGWQLVAGQLTKTAS